MTDDAQPGEVGRGSVGAVFISYRHADSSGETGRIYDRLSVAYGEDHVFRDVEDLHPGVDFTVALDRAIADSDVALVIIGKDWTTASDELTGDLRLFQENDPVRVEVETAMARGLRVFPVLVRGQAKMPRPEELPRTETFERFARLIPFEVRDSTFDEDVAKMIGKLGRLRGSLLKRVGASVLVVLVAAIVLGAVYTFVVGRGGPPSMDPGTFNVAVAEFVAVDDAGTRDGPDRAAALARAVADELRQSLSEVEATAGEVSLGFSVMAPDEAGALDGDDPEGRARSARALAEDINADIVLYGELTADGGSVRVQPEFYVSDRNLRGAEEVTGQFELGSEVDAPAYVGVANQQAELELALLTRTRAMVEFAVGLFHYTVRDFQAAHSHFDTASRIRGWEDDQGKEVLYIFLGNAATKLGDVEAARTHYDRALLLNGEYARALLGLAEVEYLASAGPCAIGGDGFDEAGLERALVSYDQAEGARVQPALSDVPAKVALGTGRTRWCLGRATGSADMLEAAEADLLAVVTEYEVGNRRIAELAAEAHANLALVYLAGAGSDANQRAAEALEEAIDLTRADDRRGRFSGLLGTVLADAGDRDSAVAALETALELVDDPELRASYQGMLETLEAESGQ